MSAERPPVLTVRTLACCGHPVSAVTTPALQDQIRDHGRWHEVRRYQPEGDSTVWRVNEAAPAKTA